MSRKKGRLAQSRRLVDMSLPPDQRGRRRQQGSIGGTPPAQMSHANSARARQLLREGERWLAAERHDPVDLTCYRSAIGIMIHGPGCRCDD